MTTQYYRVGPDAPMGMIQYLGTEEANGEPSLEVEDRRSRCYELAGYAIAFGTAPAGSRLVHGSWHGPGAKQRIGHAWLEIPDGQGGLLIWEPVHALAYDADDFRRWTRCWDERTYALPVVRQMLNTHGHYGRWHESRYP